MKQKIGLWQLAGFGAVSLAGTLLHFLYDWTGSPLAALFSGVNESTWEHMKLLFFPLFLLAIVESFFIGRERPDFWCVKLRGTLVGLLLIPILFYTLRGIFGETPDFINIGIFFLSAAGALWYETRKLWAGSRPCPCRRWAIGALCGIAVLFWIFTFRPPEIPLFLDPVDGGYGILP